ncbi:MAG: DUF3788 family protein [Ignavibacteriales bacterium]|nr:DUF3788 family protein [Ignavibacteriales bacterium]
MDTHILTNKDEFPSDEIIFSHIGKTKTYWISLFNYIRSNYPDFAEEWKFYKDGKSWLLKITQKEENCLLD